MANRYTNFSGQNYVSNFIPLPLEAIANAGAMKQKEYDTTKSALDKSLLESKIKSIEEHDPYRSQYIKSFNDQAQTLLNDPNLDFGSYEGKQKVSNLIYENANNPYIQVLSRSIKNKEDQLKNIEEVKKTKNGYAEWNDPLRQEEKLKQAGINPYIDQNGNPIEYQFRPMQTREDHNQPVYELFDKIKDSGQIRAYANFGGDQTYIQSGKTGWEGVTAKTIKAVADANVNTFKTTAGGMDFLRKFNYDHAKALARVPEEDRSKYEDQAIKEHLYDIGNAYIREKTTQDADLQATSLLAKKYEEQLNNQTTSTQSEALPGSLIEIPSEINDLEFDSKGNAKPLMKTAWKDVGLAGQNLTSPSGANRIYQNKEFDKEANQKIVGLITQLKSQNPNLQGLSDKDVVENYKKAIKSLSSESLPLQSISNVAAKNIGEAISRNKLQRNFYLFDSKGKTDDGTLETVIDKLGITEEDFDKALNNGISGYTQAGPVSGGLYIDVKDDEGNSRRVVISPDEQMKSIFRTSQMVNEARKTMTPTEVNPIPGIKILVKPNIQRDGKVDWDYFMNGEKTSLDEIRKQEREVLQESNYLGAQVGVLKPHTTE